MNENLDPTNDNFSSEDLEFDKALRPLSLVILMVKAKFLITLKFLLKLQINVQKH